jgi:hypothetical protein
MRLNRADSFDVVSVVMERDEPLCFDCGANLFFDHKTHFSEMANRDRKKPYGSSLSHHRAYGSRTRRFDE